MERHHRLRPHQLLRNRHGERRQPPVGPGARGRAHGEHADGESPARHRDDRRAQRIRAWGEQRPEHPRGARRRDRLPVAQLRQVRHWLPRRPRASAHRPAGGVLSQVLPAGQRRAGHRRTVRCLESARHGGRHRRHDSAADAHAGRHLHGRARAGRRAVRRAAPRGIDPGRDGGVARAGAGPSGLGGARSPHGRHGRRRRRTRRRSRHGAPLQGAGRQQEGAHRADELPGDCTIRAS